MNRDKQIVEMARVIYENTAISCVEIAVEIAEELYDHGYRKSTYVAREIFEEIDIAYDECIHIDATTNIGYLLKTKFLDKLAELKKKYTEGEG